MRAATLAVLALFALASAAPGVAAEFGPESEDGWPVNGDGLVLRPPVAPVMITSDLADPLNKVGPFTAYPYYPLLTAEVQRLAQEHPDLVKLTSAGKSSIGLDVWMLEIADWANPGMIPIEDRETLYFDGGTHSNEYSGVYFVTEIAQFLLDDYATNETAKWIVENRHTVIVPMVNPDGSHLFGRLNANLVNINRNYPVLWGALDESPLMNNPGPAPASEVETRIVIDVINATQPDYLATIHCCGNLWLYPYGVEGIDPLDNESFAKVCELAYPDVREDCGPIWSTIYPASGSTVDTAYEYQGSFAWGFEMSGRGRVGLWGQPVTVDDVRTQERESWNGVMHAFLNVERYGAHPVIVGASGDGSRMTFVIENDGYGPLRFGNLTVAGVTIPLPALSPGERASVTVDGAFAAGALDIALDYEKRIMQGPQGAATATLTLADDGGHLVAVGPDGAPLAAAGHSARGALGVPALAPALVALALVGAAVAARRR